MDTDVRALARSFRPGYSLEPVPNRVRRWFVIAPDGSKAENPDGTPIVLGKATSPKSMQRVRGQLEVAGVIERHHKAERGEHERKQPAAVVLEAKIPTVIAREALNDTRSTGRERALAREVLRLDQEIDDAIAELTRVRESAKIFYEAYGNPS